MEELTSCNVSSAGESTDQPTVHENDQVTVMYIRVSIRPYHNPQQVSKVYSL